MGEFSRHERTWFFDELSVSFLTAGFDGSCPRFNSRLCCRFHVNFGETFSNFAIYKMKGNFSHGFCLGSFYIVI